MPKPLSVAIVNETADPNRGGAETSIREMAAELAACGAAVTLVFAKILAGGASSRATSIPASPTPTAGVVREHPLPVSGATRAARSRSFAERSAEFCRAGPFDVIHAVTPCAAADVYQPRGGTYVETINRSIAAAGGPLRRLLSRVGRTLNVKQRFLLAAERELLTRARPPIVAAVSDYVARQVRDAYAIAPHNVRVIFNGVQTPAVTAQVRGELRDGCRRICGIAAEAPLVLFLAHNFKLKGLAELVRSAAKSRLPWHVVVLGRDDPRSYRRLARRIGVAQRFCFLGVGPAIDWIAAADVLAHPTWYDPCSRVVLEAAACGLPVVTTRYNGAADIIVDGKTGIVIDEPRNVVALARGIDACFGQTIANAARAAALAISERVSMARHARELMTLYESLNRRK